MARLARLEHSKAETAVFIAAAAAAAQKAAEERAFMDPAAAAEERNAEWERGRTERRGSGENKRDHDRGIIPRDPAR